MKFKPYQDMDAFIRDMIRLIDEPYIIMIMGNSKYDGYPKIPEDRCVRDYIQTNLGHIFDGFATQEDSNMDFILSRYEVKHLCQLGEFWFLALDVHSCLSAPFTVCLYVTLDDSDAACERLCYYVPTRGNTFNTLENKPIGNNDTDRTFVEAAFKCSYEDFCGAPEDYADFDELRYDICENFGLSPHLILQTHPFDMKLDDYEDVEIVSHKREF